MPFTHSVEVDRPPEEVFAYLDDLERHGEWQDTIVTVKRDTDGPTRVGTRATETRKVGGREQQVTYEITEHDPPRSFAFRGVSGPIRPTGRGVVEPLDGGSRSRLTIEFDVEPHGLAGRALKPIAISQARKQIPKDQQRFKARLEGGA